MPSHFSYARDQEKEEELRGLAALCEGMVPIGAGVLMAAFRLQGKQLADVKPLVEQ